MAEKTEVMAWMGETMTGHQKGRSRQPSDSAPFWRSMKRAGMFWACWSDGPLLLGVWGIFEAAILPDAFQFAAAGGDEPDFAAFVGVDGVI